MLKKFSVEWLSQSFHAQDLEQEKCVTLLPRAPDAVSDAPRASPETTAPSSPSKCDLLTVVFRICDGSNMSSLSPQTAVATPRPPRAMRVKENALHSDASEPNSARIRSRVWRRPSASTGTSARAQRRRTAGKLQLSETQVCMRGHFWP